MSHFPPYYFFLSLASYLLIAWLVARMDGWSECVCVREREREQLLAELLVPDLEFYKIETLACNKETKVESKAHQVIFSLVCCLHQRQLKANSVQGKQ